MIKSKKILFAILLFTVCLLMSFCLMACQISYDEGSQSGSGEIESGETDSGINIEVHLHSYSNSWTYDDDYHWRNAICEHKDEKGFYAEHNYDKNLVCKTCGYDLNKNNNDNESPNESIKKYVVTYNANGGIFVDGTNIYTQSVNENTLLTAPVSPSCQGYSFIGWSRTKNGSDMWQFAKDKITQDVSLYAQWAENTVEVLSVDGASIEGDSIFMLVDSDIEYISLAKKVLCSENCIWRLYYDRLGITEIPTKIAAQKKGTLDNGDNTFYIVVNSQDGTQSSTYELTIHRSYLISVNYVGVYGNTIETRSIYSGTEYIVDYIPPITGYTFNYWKDESGTKTTSFTPYSSITLYADCAVNSYKATLDVNGGSAISTTEYTMIFDDNYNLPKVSRAGYSFLGWYDGSTQITNANGDSLGKWNYASDMSITAHWQANSYNITLNTNNSSAGTFIGSGTYNYDSNVTISANTNKGYTWAGWYDNYNTLVSLDTSYTFQMGFDASYTAKWSKVTIESNNGFAGSVNSLDGQYKIGDEVIIMALDNNYLGYTWLGWYDGEKEITKDLDYTINMTAEDVTYTAKWKLNDEILPFNFTSTQTSLNIEGIKDNTTTEIVVPDYVTSIDFGAFSDCSNLESITLPFVGATKGGENNTQFGYIFGASSYSNNSSNVPFSLKEVILTGVTSIGDNEFYNCSYLTSIEIPSSVTSIGRNAFSYCSSLKSIEIPSSVTNINDSAFNGCRGMVRITVSPNNAKYKSEGECIIEKATNMLIIGCLTTNIPDYVTVIGQNAFRECSGLESITIPNSVNSIGDYAFYNCTGMSRVYISGNSLRSVGSQAFYNCRHLEDVYITDMANWCEIAFSSDSSNPLYYAQNLNLNYELVKELIVPNGVKKIGNYTFYKYSYLTSIELSNSVESVGKLAFAFCSNLTSITFGEDSELISIGDYAFSNCVSLLSIDLPSSLDTIYQGAFETCTGLTSLVIPDGVLNVSRCAFSSCKGLTSVEIASSAILGSDVFRFCDNLRHATMPTTAISSVTSQCKLNTIVINGGNSISDNAFKNYSSLTSIEIPSSVTDIGNNAFYYCSNLTSIEIPSSVTSIGESAFRGCRSLTSIEIPSSVTSIGPSVFGYCSNLTSIEIPSSVTSIGSSAFSYCSSLTSISIPSSVMSIGPAAFYNCSSLTSIDISSGVTSIGGEAFRGCSSLVKMTLPFVGETLDGVNNTHFGYIFGASSYSNNSSNVPSSLKEVIITGENIIGQYVFYECSSLTSIEIPSGVTSISKYAFYKCSSLTSIEIPSSVTIIDTYTFAYCSSLTSIEIPNSVTSIGESAFRGCSSLVKMTLPFVGETLDGVNNTHFGYIFGASSYSDNSSNVPSSLKEVIITCGTSIDAYAFSNCSSLTSIEIPSSVTSIGESAFSRCSSLTSIEIPSSVTSIGESAFYRCSSLTSIEIPKGVTSIGSSAFSGCSSLTSIEIPSSVTSIGSGAFSGCNNLTSIEIPSSVTSIGYAAFGSCIGLESMTLPFVGGSASATKASSETLFGYIFGGGNFTGGVITEQHYSGSSYSSHSQYCIPSSLKSVTIAGGNMLYGAFYNCSSLTNVTILSSVMSISYKAFYNCNNLTNIDIQSGVTSIDDYAFQECSSLTSIEIPSSVTSIGSSAFSGCIRLRNMTLPFVGGDANATDASAETLFGYIFGTSSFTGGVSTEQYYSSGSYCTYYIPSYLNSLTITGGNILFGAFEGCRSLTSIEISSNVTSIGAYAFQDCSSLINIELPSSVTSIGNAAFYKCRSLPSINIPSSVTSIGKDTFTECRSLVSVEIPSSVTSIGSGAFFSCSNLSSILIPDSVTSIGSMAFLECSSLTSIEIPSSVTSIGESAFSRCSSLTSIEIPSSVTSISESAFYRCSSLTSIEIPSSVTSIGNRAFYNCISLTSVVIPSSVTSIDFNIFEDCIRLIIYCEAESKPSEWNSNWNYSKRPVVWNYGGEYGTTEWLKWGLAKDGTVAIAGYNETLTQLEIPDIINGHNVTSIADYAFYNCDSLTSIEIPSSVTSIGYDAFYDCRSLTSVTFGDDSQLTSIGSGAFSGCNNLKSIEISSNVTEIGSYAFLGCSSLTSIVIPSSVISIGYDAFFNCINLRIYCEAESQPSGWSSHWNSTNCYVVWNYKKGN